MNMNQLKTSAKRFAKTRIQSFMANRHYRGDLLARKFNDAHSCPGLSASDRKEIDLFWAPYHVKFEDYEWHRMYYAVTGLHDPRFLPQPFAEQVLYPFCNRQDFAGAYADKNMFDTFLPRTRFPDCIGKRINSVYYDAQGIRYASVITDDLIRAVYSEFLKKGQNRIHDIIIKEAIGTFQGQGVSRVRIDSEQDLRSCLSQRHSDNFVIQMAVQQHPFFAQLNPDSVNIMRVTTWRNGSDVHIFSPCIRFGIQGSHTDVAVRNGVEIVNAVKIGPGGIIDTQYFTLDGKPVPFPHPLETRIPAWEETVRFVTESALQLPYFGFIGWDITVNDQQQPVCIEYNLKTPGTVIYQYAHGPFAGEHTGELLSFLKDDRNISRLPECIRKKS